MESENQVMESTPANMRFEAQLAVADEFRALLSGDNKINKSVVVARGDN